MEAEIDAQGWSPNSEARRRKVLVKKAHESASPSKRSVLVARSVTDDEDIAHAARVGAKRGPVRGADGTLLRHTLLGEPEDFDEFLSSEWEGQTGTPARHGWDAGGSRASSAAGGRESHMAPHESLVQRYRGKLSQFDKLQSTLERASQQRERQKREDQSRLQRLPVHERIAVQRQARALQRWERAQRDWDAFKARISRRLGKAVNQLVMTRADEYREQTEAYELIQQATPVEHQHGSDYWLMSLRGDGTRYVQVGNIFSGLFCPVKQHAAGHKELVRRPAVAATRWQHGGSPTRSWRTSTALRTRRQQLRRNLEKLRPHEVADAETLGLQVVGVDLFQWARDSTAELQGEPAPSQHAASQGPDAVTHGPEAEAALLFPASAALAQAPPLAPCAAAAGPLLQLWSMQGQLLVDAVSPQQMHPLRVPFEADAGCEARAVVRAANVGSTALFYQWQRQEVVVSLQAGVPRAGAGRDGVRRFFCSDLSGVLLPGDVRDFVITFRSAAAGVFREGWELATTPHANGAPSLQVQLSGAAVAVDENSAARRQLQAELHERAARYGVQELVWDMVERVRTPPPPPEPEQVERLQRETFEAQNPGLIYGREVFAELEALALRVLQHHGLAEDDARWDACVDSLQELARYLPPATPPATPAPAPPPTPPAAAAPPRTAEGRSPRSQRAKESPRTSPRPQQSPPPAGDSAVDEPPAAAPAAPLPSAGWSLPSASVPLRAEPVLARVAHLRECARQRPPEASPLYALARECLLAVAEQVPVAADAARVAQGLEPVAWEAPAQPVEDTAERRERRERLLEMLQRMDAEEAAEEEETAGRGKSRGKGKPARAAVGSAGKGGSRTRRAAGGEQDKLAAYLQHFRMRLFGALGDAAEQFAGSSEDALRRTRAAELAARGMSLSDRVAAADVEVAGKVVLLRADLDVELASEAAGATVAEAGLPLVDACARSVRELLQRGARKVLLLAHRGMPPVCRPPAEAEEEEEEEEQQRRLQQLEQQAAAAGAESKVTARSSSASSSSSSAATGCAATGGAATRDAHADLAGVDDEVRARFTLRPVAEALETALEEPVAFVPDAVGPAALQLLQGLHRQEAARRRKAERKEAEARRAEAKSSADDDDDEAEAEEEDEEEEEEEGARVVLLENLRFHWEEMEEERLAQARAAEEVQRSAQAAWARQERDGRREARWERREAGETGVESDTEDDSDADSVFSDHARRRAQATRAARAAAWEARFRLPPAVARFRHALARLGDVVLVDAFEASAARASSTHGLAALLAAPPAPEAAAEPAERGVDATQADTTRALLALPAARQVAAGPQLRQHLHSLARVLEHPSPPVVALLGGSARAHKFQLLLALLEVAAEVVVTGEVGVALLHCLRGVPVGDSLERLDAQPLRQAAAAVEHKARRHGARLVLPVDLVACSERPSLRGQGGEDELLTAELQEVQAQPWAGVPAGWYALDVGPHTVALAKQAAERAGTCVFVGVAGAVESSEFQEGTLGLLQALRAARAAGAFVFAAGAHTSTWITQLEGEDAFSFIARGHAAIRFLSGGQMPGVAALPRKSDSLQLDEEGAGGADTAEGTA